MTVALARAFSGTRRAVRSPAPTSSASAAATLRWISIRSCSSDMAGVPVIFDA